MSKIENKIEANDRSILQVLDKKKYTVDYFQREYSWEKKHMEQLITDLSSAFLSDYDAAHSRSEVADYNTYYLGPFVLSEKDGQRSIIDGQQRLTSLTLFLIYLHNLQKDNSSIESIESMIFSEKFGVKSFNITVEERIPCLQSLFTDGSYAVQEDDDESTINMAKRYDDIDEAFPNEIDSEALPYFIDWLKERVVLVEIIAYSDDNAYTVFETMNDRGLNLTPTEMLKGYLLSRFPTNERKAANERWKVSMQELHEWEKDEDQRFFQAWLRAQYAETIRASKAGSSNEDFEKIGTRFHSWFRENLSLMNLTSGSAADFVNFMAKDFKFYLSAYQKIKDAEYEVFDKSVEHIGYIDCWGIAKTLSYPLMLAPLTVDDNDEMVTKKMNLVAKYIEIFCVRRSVNFKNFGASSIRYTMCSLTKEIRRKSLPELHAILSRKLDEMDQKWDGVKQFSWHGTNRKFVKFILCRITGYIDEQAGLGSNFETYFWNRDSIPFEIEHIWANKFERHHDEFGQLHDFQQYRNRLGDLVLLPRGTNQSYNDIPYSEKQPHYIKENLLVKSLCDAAYQKNPNFVNMANRLELPFKAHAEYKKKDIEERQALYQEICERIYEFSLPEAD